MYGRLPSYRAMFEREGVAGPADLAIVGSAAEVEGDCCAGFWGVTLHLRVLFKQRRARRYAHCPKTDFWVMMMLKTLGPEAEVKDVLAALGPER